MKKKLKLFVVYFPVVLVGLQVLLNLFYFVFPEAYMTAGFYLGVMVGTNMGFALFLVALTFLFHFCAISRWAAIAEFLFGLNYLIVQQDNLYNIMFQVIVGTIALIATFWHYVKKFPLCRLGLVIGFVRSVIMKGSCKKGLELWDRDIKSLLLKNHYRKHL